MTQADLLYDKRADGVNSQRLTMSIFADRPHVRDQMRDDSEMAGFSIVAMEDINSIFVDEMKPLGDVVLVDCPQFGDAELDALTLLDLRASKCGAHIIVSTAIDSLDLIICCLDQSMHQVLIDPSRADRAIALGHALLFLPNNRVCELSEEDRLTLLRLTQQVGQIAERLERMSAPGAPSAETGIFRFESPAPAFANAPQDVDGGDRLIRAARPALPDPRLIRRIIRQRQLRARFFDGELFADPAWDMLLDLTAARAEHARVSVTSLCIASGVPPTTALRWIGQMAESGLVCRLEDETDRRRAFITLTDKASDAMARYFGELGSGAARLV
jgi:hypothetical protein